MKNMSLMRTDQTIFGHKVLMLPVLDNNNNNLFFQALCVESLKFDPLRYSILEQWWLSDGFRTQKILHTCSGRRIQQLFDLCLYES